MVILERTDEGVCPYLYDIVFVCKQYYLLPSPFGEGQGVRLFFLLLIKPNGAELMLLFAIYIACLEQRSLEFVNVLIEVIAKRL